MKLRLPTFIIISVGVHRSRTVRSRIIVTTVNRVFSRVMVMLGVVVWGRPPVPVSPVMVPAVRGRAPALVQAVPLNTAPSPWQHILAPVSIPVSTIQAGVFIVSTGFRRPWVLATGYTRVNRPRMRTAVVLMQSMRGGSGGGWTTVHTVGTLWMMVVVVVAPWGAGGRGGWRVVRVWRRRRRRWRHGRTDGRGERLDEPLLRVALLGGRCSRRRGTGMCSTVFVVIYNKTNKSTSHYNVPRPQRELQYIFTHRVQHREWKNASNSNCHQLVRYTYVM